MKTKVVNGKLILPDRIAASNLMVEGGRIVGMDDSFQEADAVIDAEGHFVLAGFVDIHCHAGGGSWAVDDPVKVARHHLCHGTTSILPTIAYTVGFPETLAGIGRIIEAARLSEGRTIAGINMEGPFINTKYGMASWTARPINPSEYEQILSLGKGMIRLWTIAPELDGALELADRLRLENIAVAAGHSEASGELIMQLAGSRIQLATHMMDATGCVGTICEGTREFGIDEAVLLSDDISAEVIADSQGMHVRKRMLELILKVKGPERVILITDATEFSTVETESDSDLFFNEYGQLAGSRLTMDAAVRNMKHHTKSDLISLSWMASANPARMAGIDDQVGSIEIGKRANLVIADEDIRIRNVLLDGLLVYGIDQKQQGGTSDGFYF